LFRADFLILQGLKSTKYSSKSQRNFIYLGEYLTTKKKVS
jgi:hypothetical protein